MIIDLIYTESHSLCCLQSSDWVTDDRPRQAGTLTSRNACTHLYTLELPILFQLSVGRFAMSCAPLRRGDSRCQEMGPRLSRSRLPRLSVNTYFQL